MGELDFSIISCFLSLSEIISLGLIIYIFVSTYGGFNDNIPDNPLIYDKSYQYNQKNYLYSNQCKCNYEIFNGICSKEQEVFGCINIISESEKIRNFQDDSMCLKYYQLLTEKEKISEVFDLNFGKINKISLAQLILLFISLVVYIVAFVYMNKTADLHGNNEPWFRISFTAFIILSEIARFVLLILFWINYAESQMSDYIDVLECPKINVDSFDDLPNVDKIDKCNYISCI